MTGFHLAASFKVLVLCVLAHCHTEMNHHDKTNCLLQKTAYERISITPLLLFLTGGFLFNVIYAVERIWVL